MSGFLYFPIRAIVLNRAFIPRFYSRLRRDGLGVQSKNTFKIKPYRPISDKVYPDGGYFRVDCGARPRALHERPARRDRAAAEGCGDRDYGLTGSLHPAAGSHLPSEATAPPFAVATRSAGRGTREAGSTRVGDATTALMDDRAAHPATGSHLPSEATAPPFAVAFASSPFAHPIPQSRRRASGDLFSGSLRLILCHSPCPSDSNAFVLYHVFFA
jgi:hypothetical protein